MLRKYLPALALVLASIAPDASALDVHKRFFLGVRLGDFLPADAQKGGFRGFGGGTEAGERAVSLSEVPTLALTLGYGVAKLGKAQLVLELQVERVDTSVGPETVYRDPDASTRIPLPIFGGSLANSGDEEFLRYDVGDLTLTPVFMTALFHWSGGGGRANFYAGGGPGFVLADVSEDAAFRAFKSDTDGVDDVQAEDAFGLMVKIGSDVRVSKSGNWLLSFEAEFISTGFLSSESQVRWSASDYFAGTQDLDTDLDNIDDLFGAPADVRIVDSGKMRMDGATIGLGLKYRFGSGKKSQGSAAGAETQPTEQP